MTVLNPAVALSLTPAADKPAPVRRTAPVETYAEMRARHAAARAAEDAAYVARQAAQATRWDVLQLWHEARWAALSAR